MTTVTSEPRLGGGAVIEVRDIMLTPSLSDAATVAGGVSGQKT